MHRFTFPCSPGRLLGFAIASWLALGCGGGPGDPTPDAGGRDAATDAPVADAHSPDAGDPDAGPSPIDGLVDEISRAQCAALFRCCDDAAIESFFGQYRAIPGLPSPFGALQGRLPPSAAVDATSCVDLMADLNAIAPFDTWVEQVRAGNVTLDDDAYQACLDTLESASCGPALAEALRDTDCFAYLPGSPSSEDAHRTARAFFVRTAGVGAACTSVEDASADAYGSCDPDVAFCCVTGGGSSDCAPASGTGSCVAVADLGEPCGESPVLLCRPGLICRAGASIEDPSLCAAPATTPVANGAPCMDEAYVSLGVCSDGFCSQSTSLCEARRADGAACEQDLECASANCGNEPSGRACAPYAFCAGR